MPHKDIRKSKVIRIGSKATKRIFFLQDRAVKKNDMPKTFAVLRSAVEGDFPDPEGLGAQGGTAKELFSENGIVLSVLYPDLMTNLEAQIASRPNQTSAVLHLSCAGRRVIFSGDATIDAWEWLARKSSERKPLPCDIMTIPHHGGAISTSRTQETACQRRLYTDLIRPEFGIVSVGSNNQDGHPNTKAIRALIDAGVKVLCTQMTEQCSADLEWIRLSRGVLSAPCRSTAEKNTSQSGKSRHVACFGSILAEISKSHLKISNLKRHEQVMQAFSESRSFTPMCRRGNSLSA